MVTSSHGCTTVVNGIAEAYHIPVAAFIVNNSCAGQPTSFIDVSDPNGTVINGWAWDFGDGSGTSTLQNPTYIYTSPGNYPVSLVVTSDEGCSDSYTESVQITPTPNATWSALFGETYTYRFTVDNPDPSAYYEWSFGDGGTSGAMNPTHTFPGPGVYVVCLTVIRNGCSATSCDTITVGGLDVENNTDGAGLIISPNPFVSDITVQFTLTEKSEVEMILYDVAGQVIRRTTPVMLDAGKHSLPYNVSAELSAGVYTFELRINGHSLAKKLVKTQTH